MVPTGDYVDPDYFNSGTDAKNWQSVNQRVNKHLRILRVGGASVPRWVSGMAFGMELMQPLELDVLLDRIRLNHDADRPQSDWQIQTRHCIYNPSTGATAHAVAVPPVLPAVIQVLEKVVTPTGIEPVLQP